MRRLIYDITRLSFNQWLTLISLLVLLNMVVIGGLAWIIANDVVPEQTYFEQSVFAQAFYTRTPLPTFTPEPLSTLIPTRTHFPTSTSTRVPTWTPSITPTPSSTPTPTITPTPTPRPYVAVRVRSTDTPTVTPTPNVDFAANVRQLTACENQGKHHLFIHVVDQNGNGIPGMKVRISWSGGEAIAETGTKIEDPGLADFAMFKGSYSVEVLGVISDVAGPLTPDIPKDVLCEENSNTVANSLYHYSYEVIFRKVR